MRGSLARLLLRYLLLAVGVVLLNFFIPRLLPGDPLSFSGSGGMNAALPLAPASRAQLARYYHLDEPLGRQLLAYLDGLAHGDLGWSIATPAPVGRLLWERLPWTLGLLLSALMIATIGGTVFGIVAGWRPERGRGRMLVSLMAALAAVPGFLVAIGLLAIFAVELHWFPLFGGKTLFAVGQGSLERVYDVVWHLTLPVTALVIVYLSGFGLLARDVTAGVRQEPWLTVARAKGLTERQVVRGHALPNIALPLVTYFGLRLGAVLGGALVIERVFNLPGLGLLAFQSIGSRDYPVLQALFLLSSLGVLAANGLVELIYLRAGARTGTSHA